MVTSRAILEEYRRVGRELSTGRVALEQALDALLSVLAVNSMVVNAPPLAAPVSADPDDEKFLAVAVAADAQIIVSGDKHLLRVSGWQGIEVLKPRQFVDRYVATRDG